MNGVRIGVDLGTCYSSVGYDDHHSVRFMQDPAAPQLAYSIPSCALLREDDRFVFGEWAEAERNATPEGYQREFKRDLGSSAPYWLRGRQISAAELTAGFLKFLVDLTETTLAAAPASAVITVPAYYDPYRQSLIDDAARHAGLAGTSLVAEPVAAVVSAAERGEITGDTTTLVYDLGGGTFDAAVVRLDGGKQQVLGAQGLPDFGGTDIDVLIEQDFARKAGDEFADMLAGQDAHDPKRRAQALRARIEAREFCRKIKHQLSSAEHASDFLLLKFPYELSRRELEDMVRPHLDRTVSTCRQLLASIALTPDQIDTVLFVGGASRMPMVREVVATALDRPVRRAADPELAVCMGAAILARTGPPQAAKRQAQEQDRRESQEAVKREAEEQAKRQARQQVADLQAVMRQHAWADRWPAVLETSAEIARLDPAAADPYGLATTARAKLAMQDERAPAEEQAKRLAEEQGQPQVAVERPPAGPLISARGGGPPAQLSPAHLTTITAPEAVHAVAFSPDATRLALGCAHGIVRITDLTGRQQLQMRHSLMTDQVWEVAYDSDGHRLASVGVGPALIWDARTGRKLLKLRPTTRIHTILGAAFSPDGTRLATAGSDKTTRIWDPSTGRELLKLTDTNNVYKVAYSPDGTRLATVSYHKAARIWDARTGRELLIVTGSQPERLGPLTYSLGDAYVNSEKYGKNSVRRNVKAELVYGLAFSPDGTRLATANGDETARIWDASTGRELLKVTLTVAVFTVAFSPDGTLLGTANGDMTARIWDATTGRELLKVTHTGHVGGVAFSRDGTLFATASHDKTVQLWRLK